MKPLYSDSSAEANDLPLPTTPPAIPRIDSLHHRLLHAKDADGQPIELLDELMFLLEDPPTTIGDRWQQGADLCAKHGVSTSRMSVWRLYRKHILQWRREQNPLPEVAVDPDEITRLENQARYLAAQRAIEMLNDPRLSPGHLIGLLQGDNHRQQVQLARDQFNDRLRERQHEQDRKHYQRIDDRARDKHLIPAQMAFVRQILTSLAAKPAHPAP